MTITPVTLPAPPLAHQTVFSDSSTLRLPYIIERFPNESESFVTYSFTAPNLDNNPDLPRLDGSDWTNVKIGSRNVRTIISFTCSWSHISLKELAAWKPRANLYIQALLWHDGLMDVAIEQCSCGRVFNTEVGLNRAHHCRQCYDRTEFLCQHCMVDRHAFLPFHELEVRLSFFPSLRLTLNISRISSSNGMALHSHAFFERVSLDLIDYELHLGGHSPSSPCLGIRVAEEFTILDVAGIHKLTMVVCNCQHRRSLVEQLLRARLWPATVGNPRTAVTFELLKFFQLLSFMSKVSVEEYYHGSEQMTDNTGTKPPSVSSIDSKGFIQMSDPPFN